MEPPPSSFRCMQDTPKEFYVFKMHSSQLPLQHNSVTMTPGPLSWISLFSQEVKRKSEKKKTRRISLD